MADSDPGRTQAAGLAGFLLGNELAVWLAFVVVFVSAFPRSPRRSALARVGPEACFLPLVMFLIYLRRVRCPTH